MFSNYVKLYILIVGIGLAAFMGYEKLFILAGVTIVLTFVGLLIPQNEKGDSGLLQKIETVVQRSSQGDLEQRITKIDPNSPYVLLAWSINNLLDQTEAFIRDAVTTIEKIELDEQLVTVYTDGFKGSFQSSMFPIQKALA
jgi:methyl-accepting chemotaxis protein